MSRNVLRSAVIEAIETGLKQLGVEGFDVDGVLETPPNEDLGDYAFPCFQLARIIRQSPAKIAGDLAERLGQNPLIERVEVVNAYVNFFFHRGEASRLVVGRSLEDPQYGGSDEGQGETVVLDFSSPNIAKPFHVGHLRSTIIGHSLARIFERLGYRTVRLNHLGDWGTQFGKLIVAYRLWGDEKRLADEPIKEMLDLYVRFHRQAEEQPELEDQARAAFKALEDGSEEEVEIWKRFRDLSLQEFDKVYDRLGVNFDAHLGESAYIDQVEDVVDHLSKKQLLTESEGALVVELPDMAPCLIKKKDGATLYATRDLAAAIQRYEKYAFRYLLYVVGAPQQLHFRQIFGVLDKMGYEWVDRLEHIAFGHIRLGDTQLSTRRGNVIFLEDLLDQAVARARAIIDERNPDLEDKDEVAEMVGIGAVIFNDLFHNRIKDISFDWDIALNFEGDTGPYVQYTHARAASVLRRGEKEVGPVSADIPAGSLVEDEAFHVAKRLAEYPEVLAQAKATREPSEIARYLLLLAREYNSFYHAHRVIQSEAAPSRLALTAAVKKVIADGLYLLGIDAPEAM